jgi:glucose-1-phosphate adenylyltransferase
MDLIGDDPILNPVDKNFKIYSKNNARAPQYLGPNSKVTNSLVSEGCRIYGTVENSVLSGGVIVEPGAIIKDSVVMEDVVVKKGACIYTAIVDSDTVVEEGAIVGKENDSREEIALIASGSVITK